jgi:hypothetical protein
MELRDAMEQISRIHTQLAATERLRSLRAVPVALSGVLAVAAALLQPALVGDPLARPDLYLLLWCGAAVASGIVASTVVARRALRTPGALSVANARLAGMQFLPCLGVGAVVTWFVAVRLPQQLWLLPGLWQLLFGLGNLAAHRLLPLPAVSIGVAFLATGTCCLWFGERALEPWAMGLPFATGQLALAAILWWHHERTEEPGPEVRR